MIHFYLQTLVLTHLSVFLVCILQVLARLGLTPVSPTKATVHPILLYGCEIWACEKMDVISKLQLRFLKLILGVKVTTPICMVLGEVGRYPIEIEAKCRMLGFWYGLCSTSHSESPKISNLMFQLCCKLYYASDYKLPWLMKVHSLLDSLGLSYIWSSQIHTIESFKRIVKQRLMDQFIQEWQSRVAENSVCNNYRLFKKKFCFEKYLTYLSSILRQRVLKFRLSNHRLPIQQRRSLGIPRDERICTVCDTIVRYSKGWKNMYCLWQWWGRRWISLFA